MPKHSILIVDDARIYRVVLTHYFQMAGWRVLQAEDGTEGLKTALAYLPAVIICDMVMPNVGGVELCRAVRAEPRLQGVMFVMYSGNDDEASRRKALAAGADVYVLKPVQMNDVLDLVNLLSARNSMSHGNALNSPRMFWPTSQP